MTWQETAVAIAGIAAAAFTARRIAAAVRNRNNPCANCSYSCKREPGASECHQHKSLGE